MKLEELQAFYDFADSIVLVTGRTGVLDLEFVHTLVECNANVVTLSRNFLKLWGFQLILPVQY